MSENDNYKPSNPMEALLNGDFGSLDLNQVELTELQSCIGSGRETGFSIGLVLEDGTVFFVYNCQPGKSNFNLHSIVTSSADSKNPFQVPDSISGLPRFIIDAQRYSHE